MPIQKEKSVLMILPATFFCSRSEIKFVQVLITGSKLYILFFFIILIIWTSRIFIVWQLAKENEPAAEHTTFVRVTTFGSKMYGRCDYEDSESAPSDEEERTADDELWFNPEPVKKEYNDKIGLPRNIIEKVC